MRTYKFVTEDEYVYLIVYDKSELILRVLKIYRFDNTYAGILKANRLHRRLVGIESILGPLNIGLK